MPTRDIEWRVAGNGRINPAGVLFARSGLLVEGETEAWLLARICGYGFPNLSR